MIIFIWIIVIIFILFLFFKKSSPDNSTIEKIVEGNFQAILTMAENKDIIKSLVNLVAKLSIRKFIEKNPKEKYDTNFILSQHQLNSIFQSCKSEFIK
jgi:hypothetical protein